MTYIPRCIDEVKDLKGKKVIVRVDFNVPIKDGRVLEGLRIDASLKTIEYLHSCDAKIILISHIETKGVESPSLSPVYEYLKKSLGNTKSTFIRAVVGDEVNKTLNSMEDGDILLLENLRIDPGEKSNDSEFAQILASYAELYVNDAFPVCHREHASVVGIPKIIPGYAGFNLINEIRRLEKAFDPEHPFVFILGGAKFDTKMPIINKFLPIADTILIGGALINDVYKAMGYEVGKSLVSDGTFSLNELLNNPKVIIPKDVVVTIGGSEKVVKLASEVLPGETIVDVGPQSVSDISQKITDAKFILWNGPLGNFEKGFKDQTLELAEKIVASNVQSVIGGGDTTAAIQEVQVEKSTNIFVSTGGGAMLEYLNEETLPGIEALKHTAI